MSTERKKAVPKGKMTRFSDVHVQQFKKMDSIANHASAFRADPSRFKPVGGQPLRALSFQDRSEQTSDKPVEEEGIQD